MRARERLSDKSFAKMWNAIVSEDDSGRSCRRGSPKKNCAPCYPPCAPAATHTSPGIGCNRFLSWCIDSQIPELLTLATTIDSWWARNQRLHRHRDHQTPRTEATTASSNRSNAPPADSATPKTRLAGYDFTATRKPADRNPGNMLIARSKSKSH